MKSATESPAGDQESARAPTTSRDRLILEAVEFVAQNGFADVSLRELANALGTSHRMLIYHFGSKEALFVEVIREFEAAQRRQITALVANTTEPAAVVQRRIWQQVSAPESLAQVRLFFMVCGKALDAGPEAAEVLSKIVGDWVEPLLSIDQRQRGVSRADSKADLRVGIAVMRGLLLDLLATGDRRGVNRAFERFVQRAT